MKNYWVWILIAVVLVGGYFFLNSPAPMDDSALEVDLMAINESGIEGVASFTEDDGRLVVYLTLNDASGVAMPAHIHAGVCPGVGPVVYPLESVVDGSSVSVLEGVTIDQINAGLPLAINVHRSAEQIDDYVSCGSIAF